MDDQATSRMRRIARLEERVTELEGRRLNVIDVERLALRPDDVLFVHVAEDTAPAQMDEVARIISEHLGTRRVLILAGDTSVSVGELPEESGNVTPPRDTGAL